MAKSLLSTRRLQLNPSCKTIFFFWFLLIFFGCVLLFLVDFFVRGYGVLYDLVVFEYFTLILVFAFAQIFYFLGFYDIRA